MSMRHRSGTEASGVSGRRVACLSASHIDDVQPSRSASMVCPCASGWDRAQPSRFAVVTCPRTDAFDEIHAPRSTAESASERIAGADDRRRCALPRSPGLLRIASNSNRSSSAAARPAAGGRSAPTRSSTSRLRRPPSSATRSDSCSASRLSADQIGCNTQISTGIVGVITIVSE